jgi:DNA-binding response OmpR family regulator
MNARILWIEGKRADSPSFIPTLRKKDYWVETFATGSAAMDRLMEFDPDLIVINAASMRTSGKRICHEIHEKASETPIVLILDASQETPVDTQAKVVLKLPFTTRKLLNRIQPLLPGDGEDMLHVGNIRLDLERKRVRCQGRETRLTPRLTRLLEILMQHPGEVIERERLFQEVWSTHYTEDTRTLDVHISWLRQAIEEDARNPRFIRTIRGVGYRLDA